MAAVVLFSLPQARAAARADSRHRVQALHIQILSTMLADSGLGEWGFAALVEAGAEARGALTVRGGALHRHRGGVPNRHGVSLERGTCVVGAVGTVFRLGRLAR